MNIKFSSIILILFYSSLIASSASSEEIRTLFNQSATSENACSKLLKLCNEQSSLAQTTLLGYKGCATMMMTKYYLNPIVKLSSFNAGKKILETAITTDLYNVELRYLRLTIQNNAPAFLGYNKNIEQDKLFLEVYLPSIKDDHLKSIICTYLKSI